MVYKKEQMQGKKPVLTASLSLKQNNRDGRQIADANPPTHKEKDKHLSRPPPRVFLHCRTWCYSED